MLLGGVFRGRVSSVACRWREFMCVGRLVPREYMGLDMIRPAMGPVTHIAMHVVAAPPPPPRVTAPVGLACGHGAVSPPPLFALPSPR